MKYIMCATINLEMTGDIEDFGEAILELTDSAIKEDIRAHYKEYLDEIFDAGSLYNEYDVQIEVGLVP